MCVLFWGPYLLLCGSLFGLYLSMALMCEFDIAERHISIKSLHLLMFFCIYSSFFFSNNVHSEMILNIKYFVVFLVIFHKCNLDSFLLGKIDWCQIRKVHNKTRNLIIIVQHMFIVSNVLHESISPHKIGNIVMTDQILARHQTP